MIKQYKSSIKKELLRIILSISIIAILIGYIVFIIEYMKKEQNEDIRLTKTISKVISQNVAKIVFDNDISTATDITTALKAFPYLDELIIYNSTGKILFEYSKSEISKSEKFNKSLLGKAIIKNGKLEVYDKLLYKDIFIAYVKYSFKLESLKYILVDSMPYLIFILIIMLFVAYFLAKYGAQKFTAPIINLVKFLENIIQNKSFLHNRVTIEEKNEIGLLYEEVNTMLETIEYSLIHDNLTGLYNRSSLMNDIYRFQDDATVMLIDISGFKKLNDIYGNEFGDKILIKFAKTLKKHFNNINKIYRIGGNEFAVIFIKPINEVMKIVEEFLKFIKAVYFKIDNIKVNISVNIAVNDVPPLLENADLALKVVKKDINNSLIQYKKSLNIKEEWQKNIKTTNMVKLALQEDRIVPYFQGIVNLKTLQIEKYECLVRLILPDGKVLSPYFFLDIASKTPYYYDITKVIIKKSIQTAKKYPDVRFSINFSMKDILNEEITNLLFDIFDKDKKTASRIDIELLETELIEVNNVKIYEFIKKVHSYGSKILIDDFGTGYSNFSYLVDLNVDIIKIDASITKEIIKNPKKLHILKTIHNFTEGLNMLNVAEFVETKEIALLLQEIGIEYAQGYFFSKPAPKPLENSDVSYKLRDKNE